MSTIIWLSNCKIAMYPGDHAPPHFHLRGPNSNALIRLSDLKMERGWVDHRDLEEAKRWAEANRTMLLAEWSRLNER